MSYRSWIIMNKAEIERNTVTDRRDYINAYEDIKEPKMPWETFKRILPICYGDVELAMKLWNNKPKRSR